jgi:hypothetical protein
MSSEVTDEEIGSAAHSYETPSEVSPHGGQPEGQETAEGAGVHLPAQSIWPITSAFGVALIGFGLVTIQIFCAAGALLTFYGIYSWVQELRHESH